MLDGGIYPLGTGPIPPLHMNCRSISVPVLAGTPAPAISITDWLNEKGEQIQNSILGKTRADLFRTGKLSISEMVKGDGTVLTLDQLKAVHSDILS